MNVDELLQRVGNHLTVGRAFGPSHEHEGALLIPVALVAGGGGAGGEDEGNGGGGFGGVVYPLGCYVVRDGQVRFVPSFDATRLVAGALAILRLVVKRSRSS